jgi:hypothetical protein
MTTYEARLSDVRYSLRAGPGTCSMYGFARPPEPPPDDELQRRVLSACDASERSGTLERVLVYPCACGRVHRIAEKLCDVATRAVIYG